MSMKKNIWAHESFDINEDIIWLVPYYLDLLCGYSLKERKIVFAKVFSDFCGEEDRYLNVKYVDGNLVIIPSYGDCIYVYNIRNDKTVSYSVKKCSAAKFFQCLADKKNVYVFPFEAESYIHIILKKDGDPVFEEIGTKHNRFVSTVFIDGSIYGVNRGTGVIDLRNDTFFASLGNNSDVVLTDIVNIDSEYLAILDANGFVYRLNKSSGDFEKWFNVETKVHSIAFVDDKIMLFPENDKDYFFVFDLKKMELKKINLNLNYGDTKWSANAFSKAIVKKGAVYVMNTYSETLLRVNPNNLSVEVFYIPMPELTYVQKKMICDKTQRNGCITENKIDGVDLSFYLSYVCNKKRG